jgi:hypothetical protein
VRRPSLLAIVLALTPFVAMCFSVSLWDRVNPMVLGLPFNIFWLSLWLLLTPVCMWAVYQLVAAPQNSRTVTSAPDADKATQP